MLRPCVCNGQVEPSVAVEVPRHDRVWGQPDGVGHLGLEGAVAVAQQHGDAVGADVRDGQVESAVAVEVSRHDGVWARPHGVGHLALALEGPVAVAQQHRNVA